MLNKIKIPYTHLGAQHARIKQRLMAAVEEVLESGKFILGPPVEAFEARFASLCGRKFAVGVGNGTDALVLALKILGIGPGDEVITVANTFVSTVSSIVMAGARPVFVDVRDDYNIDPGLVEKAITPRTKAILPVHLTGRPADMDPLMALARQYGLKVVEDCAQAVGAQYKGQKVGSFSDIACFSLHPLKILNACGDGGVMVTDNPQYEAACRVLRDNGMKDRGECAAFSSNSRLDSIQAAILLVKMDYIEAWTQKRIANAQFYQQALAKMEHIHCPADQPYVKSVYSSFVIQAKQRDQLKSFLEEKGIATKIHYPIPVHLQPAAQSLGYRQGDLPVTEKQARQILSLPVYPELTQEELKEIVRLLGAFDLEKVNA